MASRPMLNQSEVGRLDGKIVVLGRWLYEYLIGLGRNPLQAITTPTPGASPWTYTNDTGFDLDAAVTGGTVSAVQLLRGATVATLANATPTVVRLSPGDALVVTYTVAPTVTIIPR